MSPTDDYKLISFELTPLFTNAPLDYTISIVLKKIYDQRELEAKMLRKEMKDLLLLCTPKTHIFPTIINCMVKRMVLQLGHP